MTHSVHRGESAEVVVQDVAIQSPADFAQVTGRLARARQGERCEIPRNSLVQVHWDESILSIPKVGR